MVQAPTIGTVMFSVQMDNLVHKDNTAWNTMFINVLTILKSPCAKGYLINTKT